MSFNRVILVGNLTRDPEVKYLASGTAVGKFGLAVNRTYKKDEKTVEEVTFIDIDTWGRTAELCGEYLAKGRKVLVEGRLKMDSWEVDGQKRSKLLVVAETVQFLSNGNKESAKLAHDVDEVPSVDDSTSDVPF